MYNVCSSKKQMRERNEEKIKLFDVYAVGIVMI